MHVRQRCASYALASALALAPVPEVGCATVNSSAAPDATTVDALASDLLAHLRDTSVAVRLASGLPISRLDDLSVEQAQRESDFSRRQLAKLQSVDLAKLSHEQWLLARMLRHTFETGSQALEDYWLHFAVTPYSGAWPLYGVQRAFAAQPLAAEFERDNYLQLLDAYAALLEQIVTKTRGQEQRDIRVPRPAIGGVRATFTGMKASAVAVFTPDGRRLLSLSAAERASFLAAVGARIERQIVPGYDRVVAIFDAQYEAQASEQVGLGRLPGGAASYLRRIKAGTGLKLNPEQIHERGLETIALLEILMREIRAQLGYRGTAAQFHEFLRSDRRFIAASSQDVEQRYLSYMRRIDPLVPRHFSKLPRAPYRGETDGRSGRSRHDIRLLPAAHARRSGRLLPLQRVESRATLAGDSRAPDLSRADSGSSLPSRAASGGRYGASSS